MDKCSPHSPLEVALMWVSGPQHEEPQSPPNVDRVQTRRWENKVTDALERFKSLTAGDCFSSFTQTDAGTISPPSTGRFSSAPPTGSEKKPPRRRGRREKACPMKNHLDLETHKSPVVERLCSDGGERAESSLCGRSPHVWFHPSSRARLRRV